MTSQSHVLPEEILALIVNHVAVAGDQSTLASICQSSTACRRIATPALYHDFDPGTFRPFTVDTRFHKFVTTLLHNPPLRQLVRKFHFACEGSPPTEIPFLQPIAFGSLPPAFGDDDVEVVREVARHALDSSRQRSFLEKVLRSEVAAMIALLLALAPQLHTVELERSWILLATLRWFPPDPAALRALRRIEIGRADKSIHVGAELFVSLLDIAALEHLAIWHVASVDHNLARMAMEKGCALRSLVVREAGGVSAWELGVLLMQCNARSFRGLASFTLELSNMDGHSTYFDNTDLGSALRASGAELEFVEIVFNGWVDHHGQATPSIGPLKDLVKLKQLVAPVELLLGKMYGIGARARLVDVLPHGLEMLVITGQATQDVLGEQLEELRGDVRFAGLKDVRCMPTFMYV